MVVVETMKMTTGEGLVKQKVEGCVNWHGERESNI